MAMQRTEYKEWHGPILASVTCQNQLPRNPRLLPLMEKKLLQGLAILMSVSNKQIVERVCANYAHTADDRHAIDTERIHLSDAIRKIRIPSEQWDEKFLIPNS